MRPYRLVGSIAVLGVIAAAWSCNGQPPGAAREVAVSFEYVQQNEASGSSDPNWTHCIHSYAVSDLVLYTSWGPSVSLEPIEGRRLAARLEAVSAGERQWVMLYDIALCDIDPGREPLVTRGLSANGVQLTRVIQVDGHPALSFSVSPDGTVQP
ncbi:MAG: hypothetical protein Q8R92_14500 [Deltaproteobacteria bacterium]|nr:hypothetical protein [Deltaproteobacteria bacterium]